MHQLYEQIQEKIFGEIRSQLKAAWNRARIVDVTTEFAPIKKGYDEQEREELDNAEKECRTRKDDAINSSRDIQGLKREINDVQYRLDSHKKSSSASSTDTRQWENLLAQKKEALSFAQQKFETYYDNIYSGKERGIKSHYDYLRQQAKHLIQKKYDDEFIRTWQMTALPVLRSQFDAFRPDGLLRRLLERHPWLRHEEPSNTAQISIYGQFLREILQKSFLDCLQDSASIKNWSQFDLKFQSQSLKWREIDDTWLTQVIQGYPLSRPHVYEQHVFPSCVTQSPFWVKPTRFDLYHLGLNEQVFNSKQCKGEIYCAPVVPMHQSELQTLSEEEKSQLNVLFVNIEIENSPVWVLLHQVNRQWTLYLPPELDSRVDVRDFSQFSPLRKELVDIEQHKQLDDLKLPSLILWHAVMIARVFPWCIRSIPVPLSQYRANVPASLLLELSLIKFHPSQWSKQRVLTSFANRAPYSDFAASEYYRNFDELHKSEPSPKEHLLGDWKVLLSSQEAQGVLSALENGNIAFVASKTGLKHPDTLILGKNANVQEFFQGIKLIEHHGISRLILSSCDGVEQALDNAADWRQKMVASNLQLTTIIADHGGPLKPYAYVYYCAARNRFMQKIRPSYLADAGDKTIQARQNVWKATGQAILNFFKTSHLDIDTVLEAIDFNRSWRTTHCVDDVRPVGDPQSAIWPFVQLAQMGKKGLDVFFETLQINYVDTWDVTYQEPVPKLSCTFDLQGSLAEKPLDYINHLKDKIANFGQRTTCAPLFENLAFILPDTLDLTIITAIKDVILALHERKRTYPNELGEVVLYNLDITNGQSKVLINQLYMLAEEAPRLQVSIRIPAWDREACEQSSNNATTKAAYYRALQNLVANNQRYARFPELKTNTQSLIDYLSNRLKPELMLETHEAQMEQIWSGDDVVYPLTAESPGIQQQLQQQVAQQYQQQAQKQHEKAKEKEVVREIAQYSGREADLITRENIEDRGRGYWDTLPENIRKHSGLNNNEKLDKIFSLWVGSTKNAAHVIERIEPEAMRKLMDFAPNFRFGIDWDRTPGFRVARSGRDGALILTYSERLEKQDLMEQKEAIAKLKRDPFARQLKAITPATVFSGDYHQFSTFEPSNSPAPTEQLLQTHWRYFATEDKDKTRQANIEAGAKRLCPSSLPADATTILARHNLTQTIEAPLRLPEHIQALKVWAQAQYPHARDEDFISALFDDFNQNRLQALGQLFNRYDLADKQYTSETPTTNLARNLYSPRPQPKTEPTAKGTERWLMFAHAVYRAFPEHFDVWKRRILDERVDWSDVLEQEEVHAMARCMATLKNQNKNYQDILWALVDAHGHAVGPMRFAEVWYGFEKILGCLEENKLLIHPEHFLGYIHDTMRDGNFNATHFLYRLNFVLQHVANKNDSHAIQQRILNDVHKYDWRHNGLYYACRYEKYRCCDASENLTKLDALVEDGTLASYDVLWDTIVLEKIKFPVCYALRYADACMQIDLENFDRLKGFLKEQKAIFESAFGRQALRLFIASLAIGTDHVTELDRRHVVSLQKLTEVKYADILPQLNRVIPLDQMELVANSYQMRLVDVPLFADVLIEHHFIAKLDNAGVPFDLKLLNICGHALHCYESQGKNQEERKALLAKLLRFLLSKCRNGLNHPLVATYPWVIHEAHEAVEKSTSLSTGSSREMGFSKTSFEFSDPMEVGRASVGFWNEGHEILDILQRQLESINPKETTWFPDYLDLQDAFQSINKHPEPATLRRQIVESWIKKGCAIIDQDAPYRQLKPSEINTVCNDRHLNLSLAFESLNKPLFDRLVPFLALRLDRHVTLHDQIEPLLTLFSKLDGKIHYNELGQILGLLIEKAEGLNKHFYAIEQLTLWLKTLFDEKEFVNKPYPTEFLKELLDDAIKDPTSSLLNHSLFALKPTDDSNKNLQSLMYQISQSKLSYQSQNLLVKLAVKLKRDKDLNVTFDVLRQALLSINADHRENYFCQLVMQLILNDKLKGHLDTVCALAKPSPYPDPESPALSLLWQNNQIKFLDMLFKENIKYALVDKYLSVSNEKQHYIYLILIAALEDALDLDVENQVGRMLAAWPLDELKALANYYAQLPKPSLLELAQLVNNSNLKTANKFIHQFETVVQATDAETKKSKRHYSVSENDLTDLKRVLAGFKLKGKGFIPDDEQKELLNLLYYTNTFSQCARLSELPHDALIARLHKELRGVKNLHGEEKRQATARVLACMREVLLRKTGKWANHTQMLDLLYGALHNDESLLHQIRTGEGKSIITVMRTVYRALNGQIVDVFSSKDSLSSRDHEEFCMVFDAFGIRHNHLTEKSDPNKYHSQVDRLDIGAVNYCTIGNWSLFISGVIWQNLDKNTIHLKSPNRVAYVDEGDHILRDENTQFNFSDSADSPGVYNFDEWVYREAYDFYVKHHKEFEGFFDGTPTVTRNNEIRALCERLQEAEWQKAPKESRFFREYIIPALQDPSEKNFEYRDQQLRQLLTAAHIAYGLKENIHYCVMPETRIINNGVGIDTSFAKVVINNQVYHGSTYSEWVQHFLHIRLNNEAVSQGKKPNFFVEPDSEIALSLNARYIIKNYYGLVEACTGTSGDGEDLKYYEDEFNIRRVIKLPTHAEIRTEFLSPVYVSANLNDPIAAEIRESLEELSNEEKLRCIGQAAQVETIVQSILKNQDQPILITCEDDNVVQALGAAIQARLKKEPGYSVDTDLQDTKGEKRAKFILDVNSILRSDGRPRTEADVLPFAGRKGSITISSRMGRGTDIKPYDKNIGLRVIRTYPIHPRVAKQEQGRQGRNGARGVCQDILNYNAIDLEYQSYTKEESPHKPRFERLLAEERKHLEQKLAKHARLKKENKKIWVDLEKHEDKRENYLITRTLQRLKQEIHRKTNRFIRRKEDLLAVLSGHVMEVLPEITNEVERDRFKREWKRTRRLINSAWNRRLANTPGVETDEIYNKFFVSTYKAWQSFCGTHLSLNAFLLAGIAKDEVLDDLGEDVSLHAANQRVINVIQKKWLPEGTEKVVSSADIIPIRQDRKILKRMQILYHSDKPEGLKKLRINKDQAIVVCQQINALMNGLQEKINQASESGPSPIMFETSIPHTSDSSLSSDLTQRHDMPQVISFYQAWFSGMQKHIFTSSDSDSKEAPLAEGVVQALYGKDKADVDQFFQKVGESSCHDRNLMRSPITVAFEHDDEEPTAFLESKEPEPEPIPELEQTKRRQNLFGTLTNLFKENSACYVISVRAWKQAIEILSQATEEHVIKGYPEWLNTFFSALGDKTPRSLTSADEVVKLDRLFHLMFNIYRTVFIRKNNVSSRFTSELVDLLLNRYADHFDELLLDRIETLFTSDKAVSQLLLLESNRCDLIKILDVLVEDQDDPTLETRLSRFINHVNKDQGSLEKKPSAIRPIFELLVATKQKSFVPEASKLPHMQNSKLTKSVLKKNKVLTHMQNSKLTKSVLKKNKVLKSQGGIFLDFLSKRPGFTEQGYLKFKTILEATQSVATQSVEMLTWLSQLPPYVSIDYLTAQLQDVPGKYDVGQLPAKLKSITESTCAFNQFLHARGVIASAEHYQEPVDIGIYDQWKASFEKMSLAMAQTFFTSMKDCHGISDKVMLGLADEYIAGRVSERSALHASVALLKKVQGLAAPQRQSVEAMLQAIFDSKKLTAASSRIMFEHLDAFVKLIEFYPGIREEWCQACYQTWQNVGFEPEVYNDLCCYMKTLASIPAIQTPLLEQQILALPSTDQKDLDKRLKAMIYFAEHLRDHQLDVFTSSELERLNQLWMTAFEPAWLDTHIALGQHLAKLEARTQPPLTCFRKAYWLYANHIDEVQRLNEALALFNQSTPLPPEAICTSLLFAYLDKEITTSADFKTVVTVYQQLTAAKFTPTCLSTVYLNELQHYTQKKIDELNQFIMCVNQHDLPPEAIDTLFLHFRGKPLDELKSAIEIMTLAIQLSEKSALFEQYFSRLDKNQHQRVLIMRYVHHGLLDFLGQPFKNQCINKHRALHVSASRCAPWEASPKRVDAARKLQGWYSKIFQVMHELMEVMRSPVDSVNFQKNPSIFSLPKKEHTASFKAHRAHYASFWFSANDSRKVQAKAFFDGLERVNRSALDDAPQLYYTQIFDKIYQTQQAIIHDDSIDNQKRWFTNLNGKGYSRLYDTTSQILSDVLQDYHAAIVEGKISPEEYQSFRSKLIEQVQFHLRALFVALPNRHALRLEMKNVFDKSKTDEMLEIESLRDILSQKEHEIPKHLHHLMENARCYLKLTETNFLQVDSVVMGMS